MSASSSGSHRGVVVPNRPQREQREIDERSLGITAGEWDCTGEDESATPTSPFHSSTQARGKRSSSISPIPPPVQDAEGKRCFLFCGHWGVCFVCVGFAEVKVFFAIFYSSRFCF